MSVLHVYVSKCQLHLRQSDTGFFFCCIFCRWEEVCHRSTDLPICFVVETSYFICVLKSANKHLMLTSSTPESQEAACSSTQTFFRLIVLCLLTFGFAFYCLETAFLVIPSFQPHADVLLVLKLHLPLKTSSSWDMGILNALKLYFWHL